MRNASIALMDRCVTPQQNGRVQQSSEPIVDTSSCYRVMREKSLVRILRSARLAMRGGPSSAHDCPQTTRRRGHSLGELDPHFPVRVGSWPSPCPRSYERERSTRRSLFLCQRLQQSHRRHVQMNPEPMTTWQEPEGVFRLSAFRD